jgi:CheY-like chemotaxis protein
MKILIAEDDKFLANAYRLKFTKLGWDAKIVSDGKEVVEYLNTQTPDILLLDLIMPNMDGFEVLEKIKHIGKMGLFPIIVASNLGQKEDIERALELGAVDFLVKSEISIDALVQKILKYKQSAT